MQATIPSSYRFSANGSCTAAALHAMVDNATLSNIAVTDFEASKRPVFIGGTQPESPVVGQLWFLSNYTGTGSNPIGVVCVFNGANFEPVADGYNAKAAGAITAGDVVFYTNPTSDEEWVVSHEDTVSIVPVGVAAQTVAQNENVLVITKGVVYMRRIPSDAVVLGAVQATGAGVLSASTTAVTSGCFARVLDKTNKIAYYTGFMKAS